ncbi:MAG: hypothetical protein QXF05_00260 [Thermofilaceae archaeon]
MGMTSILHVILVELLKKGTITEKDLYESVRKSVENAGGELPRSEFLKLLMTLELRGYIKVEGTRRVVQLVRTPSEAR